MGLTPEKRARLRDLLGALPVGIAAQLAAAVEADKRMHASGLPHDFILEALKAKLTPPNGRVSPESVDGTALDISEVDQLARAAGLCLRDDHANLVEVVGLLLERAPREIAKAMPARDRGSFAAIRLPDLSRPVSSEAIETAMRYARLMMACRTDPRAASLANDLAEPSRRVLSGLRSYAADMVREKRAAVSARAAIVDAQFSTTIALVAIFFGKEEAGALRRRARAAEVYSS